MRMPRTTRQAPRIFISHSSKDVDFVKRLATDLCYVLNDDAAVWYDVLGLHGGDAWWPRIVQEINASDVFILVISPDAMKSPWVDDELQVAWRHKNARTAKKKQIIPLHFRECKKVHDYLKNLQWVQFLPPETYQSAFNKLLKDLKVSFDTRTNEFLRKLETLNSDFARPVVPKTSADFDARELEETLNLLGKYTAYYISQSRWDQVLLCVEEALPLAPNEPKWLHIQQEALNWITPQKRVSSVQRNKAITNDKESKGQNTPISQPMQQQATEPHSLKSSRSSSRDDLPHTSHIKRSTLQQNAANTIIDFTKAFKKVIPRSKQKNHQGTNYLDNFSNFMAQFIRVGLRGFIATCLFDVFIIPLILGWWFSSWIVFLGSFLISFLLLIIGPVTKNRDLATVLVLGFSVSWPLAGGFIGWELGVFISLVLELFGRSALQVDFRAIAIVATVFFLIFGTCLHLVIARTTQYLVKFGFSGATSSRRKS